MNNELNDLLLRVRMSNDSDINRLYLEYQILTAMEKEEPKTYNDYQTGYSNCCEPILDQECHKIWNYNILKAIEDNEELLIDFGVRVLKNRLNKLLPINQTFTESLLILNPVFFEITDADVANFKDIYKN